MNRLLHIGTNAYVPTDKVIAISPPESDPIKRLINQAKDEHRCIQCTFGKKARSVIFTTDDRVILSPTLPETLNERWSKAEGEKK